MDAITQNLTTLEVILIVSTIGLLIVILSVIFKDNIKSLKIGKNEITFGKGQGGPILMEDAARLYTSEAVRLTQKLGDLERRQMLAEMMKHGEEGLALFCNLIRKDFREFIFTKYDVSDINAEIIIHENEFIVRQIEREMHGWIKLAMRQNSIPLDDSKLSEYVSEKFSLWDSETDEIRKQIGKYKQAHIDFLIHCKNRDKEYYKILFVMFKKAAIGESIIKKKIEDTIKHREELENYFSKTAKVKAFGCEE